MKMTSYWSIVLKRWGLGSDLDEGDKKMLEECSFVAGKRKMLEISNELLMQNKEVVASIIDRITTMVD
ncbi:hypothetical protein RD792_009136 [Penstemon davidsonii]|uniref:Uncharacterized protein n=1 Tax=Penstemon davidsonii TaxID=160366 RepID=A0ABR0DC14_9LAMI|nr:hypothetical protein RD792_009136 [Penstemon davidsonii]